MSFEFGPCDVYHPTTEAIHEPEEEDFFLEVVAESKRREALYRGNGENQPS